MEQIRSTTGAVDRKCAVYLLDIGKEQYGDAVLCAFDNITVLIDGAHLSSKDHIKAQLSQLFGGNNTPHQLSLLIVTHAHKDHIGCLPELVDEDFILPKWALVADPDLGWGGSKALASLRGLPHNVQRLVALLREEPLVDPTDSEIEDLERSTAQLRERYTQMLDRLRERGCTVVRYGKDDTKALVAAFSSIGMSIPGPSQEQLQICAELIAKATEALAGLASKALDNEAKSLERSAFNVARVYKDVVTHTWQHGDDSLLAEAARNNAAVNNQSIVSSFHVGSSSFLFSGDMQWSLPGGSRELHIEIEKLLDKLTGQDRCDFFKLAHHGSNNGFSAQVWERIKRPLAMGICTGTDSKGHPNPATLDELEEILQNKNKEVRWARTDHNGRVTLVFDGKRPTIELSRGEINDPSPNK